MIERAGIVYKCRHEEFVDNYIATNGIAFVFTRNWSYTSSSSGGAFLGTPTGRQSYATGASGMPSITTGMSSYNSSCSWALRPVCQFYTDNLYGNGTSGWSGNVVSDAYYNSNSDSNNFTNAISQGVINGWHFSAEELMAATNSTHGTFSKWRWYQNSGVASSIAQSGGTFDSGWKLIPRVAGTNHNVINYSGSNGGTYVSFGSSTSGSNTGVLQYMQYVGWQTVTGSEYQINWS